MSDENAKKQRTKITIADLQAMKATLRRLPKKKEMYTPSQAIDDLLADMLMLLAKGYSLQELYSSIREKISVPFVQFERAVKSSMRKRLPDASDFAAFWNAIENGSFTIDVDALPVPGSRNNPKANEATAALPEKSEQTKSDSGKAGSRLAQTAASRRQAAG